MRVDVGMKQVSQPGTGPRWRRLTDADFVLDGSDLFAGSWAWLSHGDSTVAASERHCWKDAWHRRALWGGEHSV